MPRYQIYLAMRKEINSVSQARVFGGGIGGYANSTLVPI